MKRIGKMISMLLVCVYIAMIGCNAQVTADVIVEPEDEFYQEHSEECEYSRRTYIANQEQGYANFYKNPESGVILSYVENGTSVIILCTYEDKDGCRWGGTLNSGWIRLEDFYIKYDSEEFLEEYGEDMVEQSLTFDISGCSNPVILWSYPQSSEISLEIDPTTDYAQEYPKEFDRYYEDKFGQKWVYIGYYYGCEGWICTTDPENKNLIAEEKGIPEKLYQPSEPKLKEQFQLETIIIISLVVLVVVVTVVAIRHIYRKEKH